MVDGTDDDDETLGLFTAEDSRKKGDASVQVSVRLDQKSCEMQLDTGVAVSILPMTSSLISGHCGGPRLS